MLSAVTVTSSRGSCRDKAERPAGTSALSQTCHTGDINIIITVIVILQHGNKDGPSQGPGEERGNGGWSSTKVWVRPCHPFPMGVPKRGVTPHVT